MGKVVNKVNTGTSYIIECSDLSVDYTKYVERAEQEGILKDKIKIILTDEPDIFLDLNIAEKLKSQLQQLTSDVKDDDSEIEKFAKITTAIRKNIKYEFSQLIAGNKGWNGNFVDGLLKGKCVCSGYAMITKMALAMHGIESKIISNDRHAWNKVKLGENWYNFDMTNVQSEALTIYSMGNCLKTDFDMKDNIYQNSNSDIPCIQEPSQELIEEINKKIKDSIKNTPKLKKQSFLGNLVDRLKNKINQITNKKKENKMLPEPQIKQITEEKNPLNIYKFESIMSLNDRNSMIWKVVSRDKENGFEKIREAYIEFPKIGNPKTLSQIDKESFDTMYRALLGDRIKSEFIGRMDLVKDELGEEHWVASEPKSKNCIDILEMVEKRIIEIKSQTNNRVVHNDLNIEKDTNERD